MEVVENTPVGTTIVSNMRVTDADQGRNGQFVYQLQAVDVSYVYLWLSNHVLTILMAFSASTNNGKIKINYQER